MQSTIHHSYSASYDPAKKRTSLWKKFIDWADGQEENRIGWIAFAIAGHGCVFTIITSMMVLVIAAMVACLVVNLAVMPTKVTIPVFFFSLVIDLVVIVICLTNGFNIEATYV